MMGYNVNCLATPAIRASNIAMLRLPRQLQHLLEPFLGFLPHRVLLQDEVITLSAPVSSKGSYASAMNSLGGRRCATGYSESEICDTTLCPDDDLVDIR